MTRKGSGDNSSREEVGGVADEWPDRQIRPDLTACRRRNRDDRQGQVPSMGREMQGFCESRWRSC
jgi:hypothetical protein